MHETGSPGALGSNVGLGPNVHMPEPIGGVMPEDGTEYVDCYSAAQMYDYAMACVVAATTECSQHWQATVTGLEQAAGLLALDRAELRKALRAMLYDDDHDAAKNAARAALADLVA
jgi:hypothetical protein